MLVFGSSAMERISEEIISFDRDGGGLWSSDEAKFFCERIDDRERNEASVASFDCSLRRSHHACA